jgi:hypothetical protein
MAQPKRKALKTNPQESKVVGLRLQFSQGDESFRDRVSSRSQLLQMGSHSVQLNKLQTKYLPTLSLLMANIEEVIKENGTTPQIQEMRVKLARLVSHSRQNHPQGEADVWTFRTPRL